MMSGVEGLTGVALDYPTQFNDLHKLETVMDNFGLALGMVEIDLFSSAKWKCGSLCSTDKCLRKEAIHTAKQGMDAAIEAFFCQFRAAPGETGLPTFQVKIRRISPFNLPKGELESMASGQSRCEKKASS